MGSEGTTDATVIRELAELDFQWQASFVHLPNNPGGAFPREVTMYRGWENGEASLGCSLDTRNQVELLML